MAMNCTKNKVFLISSVRSVPRWQNLFSVFHPWPHIPLRIKILFPRNFVNAFSMAQTPQSAHPANRLAREKSPYLLQHAYNPVDWHAWNEEAFAQARREDKPVFLSIGYSTCHWCHVMERESFEDEKVAAFLREHFVSIKVDREERPDVDKIYMTFVQSTTGGGGWPLNVFLTPDLKPFFGGTYFPPEQRHGRPSFLQMLRQIAGLWRERKLEVAASAEELHARLELVTARDAAENQPLTPESLRRAAELFKDAYDPVNGGFGGAPKFPQPAIPALLLRAAKRFGDATAAEMVLRTCEKMAAGGIHDQLGGGFARYAVDAEWLVPHFEKMLYDNAQLTQLYLDAHLLAGDRDPVRAEVFAAVARDILDYVRRDLTHAGGGFFSAEDADSEGHEGKFYCWTHEELARLLAPEEFNVAARYFGITKEGNFTDHSHPQPLPGQNVLSVVHLLAGAAAETVHDRELLESARKKMTAVRAVRIRPHLDDKVLASWNGLMLGAFARASIVLDDEAYRQTAEKNADFIRDNLWVAAPSNTVTGALYHRWREGERDAVQLLEGYAFMLDGVIHLYEATLKSRHLDFAIELAGAMIATFYDPANGGFWQSPAGQKDLILRVKDDYDGAEPSGNSVAVLALLKLAALTGREDFREPAEATLRLFAARLQSQPAGLAGMLQALDFWLDEPHRVVLAGENLPNAHDLLRAAHSVYQPNKIVSGTTGAVAPFSQTLPAKNEAVVYLCTGNACQAPTSAPARVKELLA
jgi:hypothetical protein